MSVGFIKKLKHIFTEKEIIDYHVTVSDVASSEAYVKIVPVYKEPEETEEISETVKKKQTLRFLERSVKDDNVKIIFLRNKHIVYQRLAMFKKVRFYAVFPTSL